MIIHFEGIPSCEIYLNQNEFVEKWVDIQIANAKTFRPWVRGNSISYHTNPKFDAVKISKYAPKQINRAIDRLEKLTGVRWPYTANKRMSFPKLNDLHRMFTTSHATKTGYKISKESSRLLWDNKQRLKPSEQYYHYYLGDTSLFKIPKVYNITNDKILEFDEIIEEINAMIHIFEDSVVSSPRSRIVAQMIGFNQHVIDIDWILKDNNGRPLSDYMAMLDYNELKPEYYNVDLSSNVFQIKSIRGKDYLTAYQQYDDPKAWDITRTSHITGGLTLDPFNLINGFYNSKIFKKWLSSEHHPYDPELFGNLAIGRIKEGWEQVFQRFPFDVLSKSVITVSNDQSQESCNRVIENYQVIGFEFK